MLELEEEKDGDVSDGSYHDMNSDDLNEGELINSDPENKIN